MFGVQGRAVLLIENNTGDVGDGATLDDYREAVTTLEDAERIARRVLGNAHPLTTGIEEQSTRRRSLAVGPLGFGLQDGRFGATKF